MKKLLIALVAIMLLLSISGIAAENTSGAKVTISAKIAGIDKKVNRPVMIINITTDTPGNITYLEMYYLKDASGSLKLNKTVRYNESFVNNKLALRIIRPNAVPGKQYAIVKGVVKLDNKTYYKWLNLSVKSTKKLGTANNTNKPNVTQNTPSGDTGSDTNKSPGFEIIGLIVTISMVYLLKRRMR